jgi:DNA polymerase-3 subunit epsilon
MPQFPRLAFVDIETTGLGADHHRIAEIGVVTVDGHRVDEWGTLLDPGRRIADLPAEFGAEPVYFCADRATEWPRFADIAADLAQRLDGRLLVAHNARFDYAFLKAEFERAGIAFAAPVVCSLMLSRKLYPADDCHDLDAVCARHGVTVGERHRALPDARLLQRCWSAFEREASSARIQTAITELLAEPLLLPDVDAGTIEALPPKRGVYELLDRDNNVLLVGRAPNLRLHLKRYFRIDRHVRRAAEIAQQLGRIRWYPASGPLDAILRERELEVARRGAAQGEMTQRSRQTLVSIHVDPTSTPAAMIVPLADRSASDTEVFGMYETERKAANALRAIAVAHGICHRLLGLRGKPACACAASPPLDGAAPSPHCDAWRTRHLMQLAHAISPLRLQQWPFSGPIAIREGRAVHVFDRWEHLGSARTVSDAQALLSQRRHGFDADVYALLTRMLPRLNPRALHVFADAPRAAAPARARDEAYEGA